MPDIGGASTPGEAEPVELVGDVPALLGSLLHFMEEMLVREDNDYAPQDHTNSTPQLTRFSSYHFV